MTDAPVTTNHVEWPEAGVAIGTPHNYQTEPTSKEAGKPAALTAAERQRRRRAKLATKPSFEGLPDDDRDSVTVTPFLQAAE
jgi:hypothetical protein